MLAIPKHRNRIGYTFGTSGQIELQSSALSLKRKKYDTSFPGHAPYVGVLRKGGTTWE